jgi:hypothetical protein
MLGKKEMICTHCDRRCLFGLCLHCRWNVTAKRPINDEDESEACSKIDAACEELEDSSRDSEMVSTENRLQAKRHQLGAVTTKALTTWQRNRVTSEEADVGNCGQ